MDRPQREGRGRKGDKSGAIAKLREAQSGGKRRTEQYTAPSEEPIYEEVNDDHYEKIREGDNFVVDEEGYTVHYGEDEELEAEEADKQRALEAQRKKDAKKRGAFNVASKAKVVHENSAQVTKIPDVILGVSKRAAVAPKPTAAPLPKLEVKKPDIEDDADDNEDLFAELDPAAEFARVHERAPAAKKARIDDPPPEEDLPPPEPAEDPELLRQLDEMDPIKPADGANANSSLQKPAPLVGGAQAPVPAPTADVDMTDATPSQPQQRMKRPLPPPPPLSALPPVTAEPLLMATSTGEDVPRKEADGSYHFFMLDASDDPFNVPGTVYLFGKIYSETKKKYVSATIIVTGMERCLFVAPREQRRDNPSVPVKFPDDVIDELEKIRESEKIAEFQMKEVTRNYVWERHDIPMGKTNFLKVKYPGNNSPLPQNISGDTFSHIYGTNTAPLESFIIKRRIKGPSWLSVMNAEITPAGSMRCNTKLELRVGGPRAITPLTVDVQKKELPTLGVLSLNLKTIANEKHQQEVVMCTMIYQHGIIMDAPTPAPHNTTFCAVRKLANAPLPLDLQDQLKKQKEVRIEICQSERQLLNAMLNQIQAWDPDVLVAHNFYGFDLDVLLHRMQENKTTGWYRLGQLKKGKMPKLVQSHGHDPSFAQRGAVSGRLVCDTYLAAKDLLRSQKNYSLTELAKTQLGQPRAEFDYDQVPEFFETGAKLIDLAKFSSQDAYLALQLMHKLLILPLTKQLSNLAGNLWSRSLTGARAERIEFLLLHEFRAKKLVMPDKRKDDDDGAANKNAPGKKKDSGKEKEGDVDDELGEDVAEPLLAGAAGAGAKKKWKKKNKPAYEGGKVLEPKKGFYDKYILLLDFQSLYPSIVQEFNICFTTVPRTEDGSGEPPGNSLPQGLLPEVIRSLVERRREVKKLMGQAGKEKGGKDSLEYKQYDIRQLALKLVANSMYGCLGYVHSRFFAVRLAKLITKKGRETLEKTKELVDGKGNVEIIYGDTDSIMVNTRSDDFLQVLEIGRELKKEINKHYQRLEIEIDGIFRSLLLLKKKKYAALVVLQDNKGTEKQVKGLEVVRRDWCDLSREMGSTVLDIILSGKSKDEVNEAILEYLQKQAELIMANKIGLSKFIITKSISKNPEDYPDGKSQPHVQVALKMKAAGKTVRVGDHIQYIICRGDEGKSAADRAEMPETVKNGAGAYVIDTNWYLEQQILPPLLRHCDPLDSLEPAAIGKALGIAEGKVKSRMMQLSTPSGAEENYIPTSYMTDEQRFGLLSFKIECPHCKHSDEWKSTMRDEAQKLLLRTFSCLKCNKPWRSSYVANIATLFLRDAFEKYYRGMYLCEDGGCNNRSQQVYDKGYPLCAVCQRSKMRREYTETYVLERMQYLVALFSHTHQESQVKAAGKEKLLVAPEVTEMYDNVYHVVEEYLERHAGNYVDLSQLFSFKAVIKPI